jgi:hypothetical protein
VGEKLVYRMYWGFIPVGQAELSTAWVVENGRKLLALRATARTTSFVALIYPVEDFVESTVDPATFLPVRYIQRLKEGRHVRDDYVTFDYASGKARWESKKDGKSGEVAVDWDTRDVVSLVYYMRSKGFAPDQQARFRVLVDNKLYELVVTGLGQEEVEVKGVGKVPCVKVEPKAKFGAIFVRKGKVEMWFSEDERHICVRMAGFLPKAKVKAILAGIEGPDAAAWGRPAAANAQESP